MMRLLAVTSRKGGCGRSTLAVNLASELSRKAIVTVVDADPQGTALQYASQGLLPVMVEELPLEDSKGLDAWIRRVLAIKADLVVLDSPPHVGAVTQAIIGIADVVLVPCTPSTADLYAIVATVELINKAQGSRKDKGPKCLLIPSRVDTRTLNGREIEAALKKFNKPVGPTIHQRSAFVNAFAAGRWIGDYAPDSAAHEDVKAVAKRVRSLL